MLQELLEKTGKKKVSKGDIFKVVFDEVHSIWERASLPTVSERQIYRKLEKFYLDGSKAPHTNYYKSFLSLKPKLFHICTCKYPRLKCTVVGCTKIATEKEEQDEEEGEKDENEVENPDVFCDSVHIDCTSGTKVDKCQLSFDQRQKNKR